MKDILVQENTVQVQYYKSKKIQYYIEHMLNQIIYEYHNVIIT